MQATALRPEAGQHVRQFRDMVEGLPRDAIGVSLDVVFNHTNKGSQLGPVYEFKGSETAITTTSTRKTATPTTITPAAPTP
jgi:pullulanase/glycogen debranching enzyme